VTNFPRSWGVYGLCLVALLLLATDFAGLPPGELPMTVVLSLFCIACTALIQLIALPRLWRIHHWRALLPLALCIATVPAAGYLGRGLLAGRFYWNRDQYEAMADSVRNCRVPLEYPLAVGGLPVVQDGVVVGAIFPVVSHGFAGHVGFLRVYDETTELMLKKGEAPVLKPWRTGSPIAAHWYLVFD